MKFIMKLHAKHQRLCLLCPLDLNDLASAGTAALAVLLLFQVPSLRPSPILDPIPGAIVGS
jgi:hypothetical protein